jgi:hypothetical protein
VNLKASFPYKWIDSLGIFSTSLEPVSGGNPSFSTTLKLYVTGQSQEVSNGDEIPLVITAEGGGVSKQKTVSAAFISSDKDFYMQADPKTLNMTSFPPKATEFWVYMGVVNGSGNPFEFDAPITLSYAWVGEDPGSLVVIDLGNPPKGVYLFELLQEGGLTFMVSTLPGACGTFIFRITATCGPLSHSVEITIRITLA